MQIRGSFRGRVVSKDIWLERHQNFPSQGYDVIDVNVADQGLKVHVKLISPANNLKNKNKKSPVLLSWFDGT
jgi:hypothetical protein